jgi:hypothetical protein
MIGNGPAAAGGVGPLPLPLRALASALLTLIATVPQAHTQHFNTVTVLPISWDADNPTPWSAEYTCKPYRCALHHLHPQSAPLLPPAKCAPVELGFLIPPTPRAPGSAGMTTP